MEVKWIKIVTNIFDDEKIRFIETLPNGDEILVIWLKLLCLCGKSNAGGLLMLTDRIAYTDEMLSSIFRKDIKVIQMALQTFENLDMVELIDNRIYITNWEKHQSIEKLDTIREQNRIRQKRWYDKQKELPNVRLTEEVTQSNAIDKDKDIDKEKEINSNKGNKTNRFVKPIFEEVIWYIGENNYNVDAERWYTYYESNGWKVGKNPMKDWKACIRQWNAREKQANPKAFTSDEMSVEKQDISNIRNQMFKKGQ